MQGGATVARAAHNHEVDGSIPSPATILTDAPAVVDLKREFYALDLQEEALKSELRNPGQPATERDEVRQELDHVRTRKATIAQQIFAP